MRNEQIVEICAEGARKAAASLPGNHEPPNPKYVQRLRELKAERSSPPEAHHAL